MKTNITVEFVYAEFRRAQADSKNRGYRLPKDFDSFLQKRMSKQNREALILATQFFNTKWVNVNPFAYFQCGFELYKTFSYSMFFRPNIINLYKQRDKMLKRDLDDAKKGIVESVKFVLSFMNEKKIPNLSAYCRIMIDNRSLPFLHYMNNHIDKFFIVFLIKNGYYRMSDDEMTLMPYISEHYRDMVIKFDEIRDFINKVKDKFK